MRGLVESRRAELKLTSRPPSLPLSLSRSVRLRRWHPIYPVYLDAKRAYGSKGGRRIAREQAHWWPTSNGIVSALKQLGMPVFHEVSPTARLAVVTVPHHC